MVNKDEDKFASEWDISRADPAQPDQTMKHLLELFGATATPLLLIDSADLRVLAVNQSARAFLAEDADIRIGSGRLSFVENGAVERFRNFVTANGHHRGVWTLPSRWGGHAVLSIERAHADGTAVLVVLGHSERVRPPVWSDLKGVFGLTAAEERLAKSLVTGLELGELATTLGITIETARTHIKRIYTKVGVGSREQLSSVLAPFRVE